MSTFKDSEGYVVFDGDIDAICDDEVEIGLTKARSLLSSGQWNKTDEEALKTSKANRKEATRNASGIPQKKKTTREKKPKAKHQIPKAPPPPVPKSPPTSPLTSPPQTKQLSSPSMSSHSDVQSPPPPPSQSQSPPLPPSPKTPPPLPPSPSLDLNKKSKSKSQSQTKTQTTSSSKSSKSLSHEEEENKISSETSKEVRGSKSSSSSSSSVSIDPDAPELPPRGDPKVSVVVKEKSKTKKEQKPKTKSNSEKNKENNKNNEINENEKSKEKSKDDDDDNDDDENTPSEMSGEICCEVHDITSAISLISFNPPLKESVLFEKRKDQIKEYQTKREGFLKTLQYKTKVRGKELHELMKKGEKEIAELTSSLKKKYSTALKQFEKNTKKNAKRDKRKLSSDELKIIVNTEKVRLEELQDSEISNKRKENLCIMLESQIAYIRTIADDVKMNYGILCDIEESQLSNLYTEKCAQEYEKYLAGLQKELKMYGNTLKKEEKKKKRSERRGAEEIEKDVEEFRKSRDEQEQEVVNAIKREGDEKMAMFAEERKGNVAAVEGYFELYIRRMEEVLGEQKEGVVRENLDVTELPEGLNTMGKREGDVSQNSVVSSSAVSSSSSSSSNDLSRSQTSEK